MIKVFIDLPNFQRWYTLPVSIEKIADDIEDEQIRKRFLSEGEDFEIERYTIWDIEYDEPFCLHQIQEAFRILDELDFVPRYVQAFFEFFDIADVDLLKYAVFYDSEEEIVDRLAETAGLKDIKFLFGNVYNYLNTKEVIKDFLEDGYEARNDVLFEFL